MEPAGSLTLKISPQKTQNKRFFDSEHFLNNRTGGSVISMFYYRKKGTKPNGYFKNQITVQH
jgi:hypothetical protein